MLIILQRLMQIHNKFSELQLNGFPKVNAESGKVGLNANYKNHHAVTVYDNLQLNLKFLTIKRPEY
jgi:hypothetical protein